MKKTMILLASLLAFILLLHAGPIYAGSAQLSWTKPTTDSDGNPLSELQGYKIYYGTSARTGTSQPGGYDNVQTVSNGDTLNYTFSNLTDNTLWFFSVAAYNSAGESDFSNEGSKAVCNSPNNTLSVKVGTSSYYSTIQGAYDPAGTPKKAQVRAIVFNENLILDDAKVVTLTGGYGCNFNAANTGYTIVAGSITIKSGTLIVENIIIR
jgi:hypothetical protein